MEPVERRLAAILAADMVAYSRLMAADEVGTLARLKALRAELVDPQIAAHGGRIVKLMGDGMIVVFDSVVGAVECAAAVQKAVAKREAGVPADKRIAFRVGINLGDVMVDGDDVYGDGVNVAARLEAIAPAGGICLSDDAYRQVRGKTELSFEDLGERALKNIPDKVRVHTVDLDPAKLAAKDYEALTGERLELPEKPSIAVLPFVNLSGDPEQEYFSDGITQDIITALSKLRWFLVIARNSTFAYKGKAVDIRQIGRELDVRYILEGSVRRSSNRVRITAELVDTTSGVQHWSEKYDHELEDVFKLQDEITQNVTAAIEPKLVAAECLRSRHDSSADLNAWGLVMRAMSDYGRMTKAGSDRAIEILGRTVHDHPDYGPAHSLLAFMLLVSGHVGWIPDSDDYAFAARLAHRALELDDEDPWAHLALGYLAFSERQTSESVREYMRALDLNPNFATAHGYLGWALVFDGQWEEAIRCFQQALRMSPHDPLKAFFYSGTGVAYYYATDYDEAIEWARRAIRERPEFAAAYRILCASLAQAGRKDETRQAMTKLRALQPNISIGWIEQHVPYTARAMPHFLDGIRKAGLE